MQHEISDLIKLFNTCFQVSDNTILVKGDDEPLYLPSEQAHPYNRILFAHGFYTSALHEISHWCLAGAKRRQQIDYGYWYLADGRDEAQQKQFEAVEIKPQAIEWILSVAAGLSFKVSCDNLNGSYTPDRHAFRAKIYQQVEIYLTNGLPFDAARLVNALRVFYQTPALTLSHFEPCE